jgi:cytochrome bd ubiquinol oxidase subunit II
MAPFSEVFVTPWLGFFPMLVGLLALAMFALLAATYLTVASADAALREDFRRRALAAEAVVLLLGAVGLFFRGETGLFPILAGAAAVVATGALWKRRYPLARIAVGAQVSLILWGWAATQYPFLIPGALTIRSAAAPDPTLTTLLWVGVIGAALLLPSLGYLMRLFASRESLHD